MRRFEVGSIIINSLLILIIAMKGRYLKLLIPIKVADIMLWFIVILFLINTLGNLFAQTRTETIVFTPISLISAILCLRIVKEKINTHR